MSRTWLEVDLSAIAHNTKTIKGLLPHSSRLLGVVKADAYGHGAVRVAEEIIKHGVSELGVAIPEEGIILHSTVQHMHYNHIITITMIGIQLRRSSKIPDEVPILVFSYFFEEQAILYAQYRLTATVGTKSHVDALVSAAKQLQTSIEVQINIDTGVGNIGVRTLEDVLSLYEYITSASNSSYVNLIGIYTHLYNSSDPNSYQSQLKQWDSIYGVIKAKNESLKHHISATAGLLNYPEAVSNVARAGMALYGM